MGDILLIAFGKRGYGLMAHNLALSLAHYSPDVRLTLYVSDDLRRFITSPHLFHQILPLPTEYYLNNAGVVDPAVAKTQLYRLGLMAGLEKFLYLDVDALALNDISPLLTVLEGSKCVTEVLGKGGKDDDIPYNIWATSEKTWDFFNLAPNATLCGIQSSWMYFERSDVADKVQEYLDYFMDIGIPRGMVVFNWGGTTPDELLYQGVFAKMGMIPQHPKAIFPIYFGHSKNVKSEQDVRKDHYLLSIYGNGKGNTLTLSKWFKMYDNDLRKLGSQYLWQQIAGDKHANAR
jgi:hypothetical protein